MSKVTSTGSGVSTGVSGARLGFFLCLLRGQVCIPLGHESSASSAELDRSAVPQDEMHAFIYVRLLFWLSIISFYVKRFEEAVKLCRIK